MGQREKEESGAELPRATYMFKQPSTAILQDRIPPSPGPEKKMN